MTLKSGYQELLQQKRFLEELEYGIRFTNREIINKIIPVLNKNTIFELAVSIARLRGLYLDAAFKIAVNEHGQLPEETDIRKLKRRREMFEETKSAFDALSEAIKRGYIDLDWDEKIEKND